MKRIFIIKLFLFIFGLVLVLGRIQEIVLLKTSPAGANVNVLINKNILCEKQDGFYALDDNTLDVVFIGSSNIHCNINPNIIWHNYGITSYNYSCDQQELGTTVYYLKQVFETQSPKVVVIDVMGNGDTEEIETLRAHFAFDFMKNDTYKIQAIWDRTKHDRMEMLCPIITYHERWKSLEKNDYQYKPNQYNFLKGTFIYMLSNKLQDPQNPSDYIASDLPERTIGWLEMCQEICQEHNCQCLFIKTPYGYCDESWFSYFNAVEDYCESKGIPFIYMNKLIDEIGLDFEQDYADDMHMNWNGQLKTSSFVGEYIKNNYEIEDKRGREELQYWNDDYDKMMYYVDNFWELYWQQNGT